MATDIKPINYAEEYHVMKPSLFRESENLDRLLQAIFDVCDVQQKDFLWLAENLLNLDAAQGFHLDFIGSIVGQPRFLTDFNTEPYFGYEGSYQSKTFGSSSDPEVGGYWNSRSYFNTATSRQLNDEEYRRLIKARAIYNQSNCTANDLLEVINLLSNSKNNTVQMLNHGLIQINTDDSSGIISYFVDRLYLEDNILPIAAGVRVGLEQVVGGDSGDSGDGGDGGGGDENYQIEVVSDNSNNGNAGFTIELKNVSDSFSINLNTGVEFDKNSPNTEGGEYYYSREIDDSGKTGVYLSISELGGKKLGININAIADVLVINSDWTSGEENSGREIVVNELPYGISNIQFKTWNAYLEVPNYLPDTVTTLDRTFESCKKFNSDISNWDTSRVTGMSNTFYGCDNFNQDISSWDVSNVNNMEYAFIGAYSFNSDLSRWNVGKVENFDYTFSNARNFDSDLSQWDTSSARSMFRMFSSASNFTSIVEDWDVSNVENMDYMFQPTAGYLPSLPSQDLSKWCVSKVTSPMDFIGYDWTGILPIWGTCPSGD